MKKALIFILLFVLSLSLVSCFSRNESHDSVNISKEEHKILELKTTDKVIKRYTSYLVFELAEEKQIDQIIENESNQSYIVLPANKKAYYKYVSEDGIKTSDVYYGNLLYEFYQYALHPERIFDDSVRVENTYCFSTFQEKYSGTAYIYYKTSDGEFVLLGDNISADGTFSEIYLVPVEDFRGFSKMLIDEISTNPLVDGTRDITDVANLSPYKISPRETKSVKWWIPVSIVGVLICAVSLVTIAVLKKKKSQQESA